KDRDLRYKHASEVRGDLEQMKRAADSARLVAGVRRGAAMSISKRWRTALFAAAAAAGLTVAGYFFSSRAGTLTDKDTIVLADFNNKTGDADFDETLRQGLAVELRQSPY